MAKLVNRTVDALAKIGEKIERQLTTDSSETTDEIFIARSDSNSMFPSRHSAFHRPLDKQSAGKNRYASERRGPAYGNQRKHSYDHLAASPAHNSFQNYRQNPSGSRRYMNDGATTTSMYNTGVPLIAPTGGFSNSYSAFPYGNGMSSGYGNSSYSTPYANTGAASMSYGHPGGFGGSGNVGYAPEYYIAERRQVELVPAAPPRVIQQPYPVPVAVDRPVPQPYPVEVPRAVPVDRPVPFPVPVPTPVPVDRPVPVPVPVPVPSPPPPPVCVPVPVPVPSPVPCYIPVGVPVPSPPPSPVMFEQSVTHSQRWVTGSPVMMNQMNYVSSPAVGGFNSFAPYSNASFIR